MKLSGHAPALDGVRGAAALLVLVGHLGNRELFLVPGVAHDLLGKPGVWLFFALSAFLLTARLTEELEQTPDSRGALAAYALNRIFRIYPLYTIVIAAHWALGDFSGGVALRHLFLLSGWRELWAIPAEFSYYLVVPLLAALAVRFGRARAVHVLWAGLALAFLFNLAAPQFVFRDSGFIHGKLVPFLAGSLAGILALERGDVPATTWRRIVLPMLVLVGFALASEAYRALALMQIPLSFISVSGISLALSAFGVLLISLSLEPNWLGRLMGSAPLAFFGRVSFSLYLWHEPIIRHVRALQLEGGSPAAQAWLYFAVCTLAAWLSYRAIGRPELAGDPRFTTGALRGQNKAVLTAIIEDWLARQPSDDAALAVFEQHRVAAAPVLTVKDTVSHPYFAARGMIRRVPDPVLGEVTIPGFPFKFGEIPELPDLRAPRLGEHNAEVLRERLGLDAARIADLAAKGVLLSADS